MASKTSGLRHTDNVAIILTLAELMTWQFDDGEHTRADYLRVLENVKNALIANLQPEYSDVAARLFQGLLMFDKAAPDLIAPTEKQELVEQAMQEEFTLP